jgi:hypothetical protein
VTSDPETDADTETLRQLDAELGHIAPPMFVDSGPDDAKDGLFDVEHAGVRLADVGGMAEV